MRRHDREITDRGEIDTIIRGCQVCRLAMSAGDIPYLVPVSFGYDGESLYFHTARSGRKIDCMETNNRVCFEFERDVRLVTHPDLACKWTFSFQSVIGFGTVSEIRDNDDKLHALRKIMQQYGADDVLLDDQELHRTRVWRIAIRSVTGKHSSDRKATEEA